VIDINELVLGLGAEPDGFTSAQARRIVADVARRRTSWAYDRGVLPRTSHALAADPGGLPADLADGHREMRF
jgi:hypothetical protein